MINKGNLRFCTIIHDSKTYDVAVVVSALDDLDGILQEWAIATIGETLNLPEELVENKDATEVVSSLDVDSFAYLKSPVSKYMDMPRAAGISGTPPALPTAVDVNGLYPMPAAKVFLYSEIDFSGYFGEYSVEAANIQLSPGANFIGVTFNNGVPIYQSYQSLSLLNYSSSVPVAYVLSFAGTLFVSSVGQSGYGLAEKLHKLNILLNRFEIVGDFTLAAPSLYVSLSASVFSNGVGTIDTLAIDTALANNDMYLFYKDASSEWQNTKVTQLSNAKCQGVGLVDLSTGQYVVHHIYRMPDATKLLLFTVPSKAYDSVLDAINSAPLTPPSMIAESSVLVGRAIVKQGESTATIQKVQKIAFGI